MFAHAVNIQHKYSGWVTNKSQIYFSDYDLHALAEWLCGIIGTLMFKNTLGLDDTSRIQIISYWMN